MFVPYSVHSLYTDADNVPVALHEIGNATWVVVPQKPEKCWLVILHFDLSPFTMQCNLVMAKADALQRKRQPWVHCHHRFTNPPIRQMSNFVLHRNMFSMR